MSSWRCGRNLLAHFCFDNLLEDRNKISCLGGFQSSEHGTSESENPQVGHDDVISSLILDVVDPLVDLKGTVFGERGCKGRSVYLNEGVIN